MRTTPRLLRIQTAATSKDLLSLVQAVDPQIQDHCEALQIQLDPEAGAPYLLIGNSDVDATHWGAKLVAGQAYQIPPTTGNLIILKQIFIVMNDASLQGIGLSIVTR